MLGYESFHYVLMIFVFFRCCYLVSSGCSAAGSFKRLFLLTEELLWLRVGRTDPDFLSAARPTCFFQSVSFDLLMLFNPFRLWQKCRRNRPFYLKLFLVRVDESNHFVCFVWVMGLSNILHYFIATSIW